MSSSKANSAESQAISPLVGRCIATIAEAARDIGPGGALPSEAQLGRSLAVSRTPLRQALQWWIDRRFLERQGRNTVVLKVPEPADLTALGGIDTASEASKAEQCERWFLQAVSERRFRPGQRFTEVEVAEGSGATTPTVREVLAKYEARRLIHKDPRRSWQMIGFNPQVIAEVWELRRLIEHHAMYRLLDKRDEYINVLQASLDDHQQFAAQANQPIEQFRELDRAFHRVLFSATSNMFIQDLQGMIDLLIHIQLADDAIGHEGMQRGLREHMAILQALLEGDYEEAHRHFKTHMDSSEYIMNQALIRDQQ